MLIYLADHKEANDVVSLYKDACRHCYKEQLPDGNWCLRSVENARETHNAATACFLQNQKNLGVELLQKAQQHYEEVSI